MDRCDEGAGGDELAHRHSQHHDRSNCRRPANEAWQVDLLEHAGRTGPTDLGHGRRDRRPLWARCDRDGVQRVEDRATAAHDIGERRGELDRPERLDLKLAERDQGGRDGPDDQRHDDDGDLAARRDTQSCGQAEHEHTDEESERVPHQRVVAEEVQSGCER